MSQFSPQVTFESLVGSVALVVLAKARQPLPSEGPHSSEAVWTTRTNGAGTPITNENPATLFRFPPDSFFGLVPSLVGLITRGPLGLLEDWHPPVPADSRLAELPPSLDSGRYPPSPDTTGLQQPRKSRTNPNDHHHRRISKF